MCRALPDVRSIALALAAAACFAGANVAQTVAARRSTAFEGVDARLLWRLAHDRIWVAGLVASGAGFALQACALLGGPVVVVQPLIATELLFALPIAAVLPGQTRLTPRSCAGALLVTVGVAAFVLQAQHAHGRPTASRTSITAVTVGVIVLSLVLGALTKRVVRAPRARGALLALGAAACFGALSVDTRTTGHLLLAQRAHALLDVRPWLLVVTAVTGLLLAQTSFQVAPLSVTLPLIDIGEPVVAACLASLVFGEHLGAGTAGARAGVVAAVLVAVAGIVLLDVTAQRGQVTAQRRQRAAGTTAASRQPFLAELHTP